MRFLRILRSFIRWGRRDDGLLFHLLMIFAFSMDTFGCSWSNGTIHDASGTTSFYSCNFRSKIPQNDGVRLPRPRFVFSPGARIMPRNSSWICLESSILTWLSRTAPLLTKLRSLFVDLCRSPCTCIARSCLDLWGEICRELCFPTDSPSAECSSCCFSLMLMRPAQKSSIAVRWDIFSMR